MQISGLALLGSMIVALALFLVSLYYSISSNPKWTEFMALALLGLVFSGIILLYYGGSSMAPGHINSMIIATLVFLGLSALFYGAYQLIKK